MAMTTRHAIEALREVAPEGVDPFGWSEAAYDLPTLDGITLDATYWIERLKREANDWRNPEFTNPAHLAKHRTHTDAYFSARALRLEAMALALSL